MVEEDRSPATILSNETDAQARRLEYNKLVRTAEISSILLRDLRFKVDRAIASQKGQKVKITGACNSAVLGLHVDEESGAMTAAIEWNVELRTPKRKIASCKAVYDVSYEGFKQVSDEVVGLFAESNARAACYAYFRSLYANMDWAAELRFPPLPVVRFNPKV